MAMQYVISLFFLVIVLITLLRGEFTLSRKKNSFYKERNGIPVVYREDAKDTKITRENNPFGYWLFVIAMLVFSLLPFFLLNR